MSRDYVDIMAEEVPAWYEISWDGENKRLIVRVHQYLVAELKRLQLNIPAIRMVVDDKRLIVDDFIPEDGNDWGFGQVLKRVQDEPPFINWYIDIPVFARPNPNARSHPYYPLIKEDEAIYDWTIVTNISATLNILFKCLQIMRREKFIWKSPRSQLVTCSLITETGMSGGAALFKISKLLTLWLRKLLTDTPIPDITRAMRIAYYQLHQDLKPQKNQVREHLLSARIGSSMGMIHLNCPGQATSLDPESLVIEDEGFELGSNNVDNSHQQLVLLVGVAAMCDMARKDLYGG